MESEFLDQLNVPSDGVLQRVSELLRHCDDLGKNTHAIHALSLVLVARYEDLTVSELARQAGTTIAAASRHIQRLKRPPGDAPWEPGFVVVGSHPDARLKPLRLTRRGVEWVLGAAAQLDRVG